MRHEPKNFVKINFKVPPEVKKKNVPDFFIPKSLGLQYRHAKYLGSGGYGIVVGLGDVAVKRYTNPFSTPRTAQRCFRELQLLRELNHENIVEMQFVYSTEDVLENLSSVYLTMKYCGENLRQLIAEETLTHRRFRLKCFKRMISELLRALKYLNSANVIHRDLKPDNLAIDANGKLTLIDFGLARVYEGEKAELTGDPGTRYYRAIETVAFGFEDDRPDRLVYNETADIWSIGAILCEMITGVILFKHESPTKDHPPITAINICGPYTDKVLKKIGDMPSRECLRKKSLGAKRMDFLQHFEHEGRPWLLDEIRKDGASIVNFIDRTLTYDSKTRMSVDEALSHRFLSSVREQRKEVVAMHTIEDVTVEEQDTKQAVEKWKEHIWDIVQPSPVITPL